jgi:hypothetical protein
VQHVERDSLARNLEALHPFVAEPITLPDLPLRGFGCELMEACSARSPPGARMDEGEQPGLPHQEAADRNPDGLVALAPEALLEPGGIASPPDLLKENDLRLARQHRTSDELEALGHAGSHGGSVHVPGNEAQLHLSPLPLAHGVSMPSAVS